MSKQIGNVALMQKMNRLRVLNFIRNNPDVSRPAISEKTGLSMASLTNITAYLLDEGLLIESGIEPSDRVGRKSTLLRFGKERYGLILVILDDNFANVIYSNLEGDISEQIRCPIGGVSCEQVISLILEKVGLLISRYGKENTIALGMTFSGLVLDGNRFVMSSSMKWKELDIKKIFEDETGLPVFIENISMIKAASYSSRNSCEPGSNVLFVDLENGIGAVLLNDGNVAHSVLGEIGHTTIEKDGPVCFCGNRGCLEAMCSETRIVQLYNERKSVACSDVGEISRLCEENDSDALWAVDECAKYLGIGLANLIMIFCPNVLVINRGQFSKCFRVISKALEEMKERTCKPLTSGLDVRIIDVAHNETISGAAFEICDRLFDISSEHNPVQ